MNNKLKISIATLATLGGGFVTGTQINRPECAYVIKAAQEICITQEQADAIIKSMETSTEKFGFGGAKFSNPIIIKK